MARSSIGSSEIGAEDIGAELGLVRTAPGPGDAELGTVEYRQRECASEASWLQDDSPCRALHFAQARPAIAGTIETMSLTPGMRATTGARSTLHDD